MTAREIYERDIRQLPPMDRLRLASLILDDLTGPSSRPLDVSDQWSHEDIADLTKASLDYAAKDNPVEDDHA